MPDGDPAPDQSPDSQSKALRGITLAKQYAVALGALVTAVAPLWSIVEDRWKIALTTAVLGLMLVAMYFVFRRVPEHSRQAKVLRLAMITLLVLIPVISISALFAYSYLPRMQETGTTIAIARFAGPTLPQPYEDCRPSDMLVHTLSRVAARFGSPKAFELPYSIDPDDRWAAQWADFHGWFEAADVTVYGEYELYNSSGRNTADAAADEIVINPEVTNVPTIPLADNTGAFRAPLYTWDFSGSIVKVHELCGSDLRDPGSKPPRFLDDARRIALAITGLQALGREDIVTAMEADREAKIPETASPQPCSGDPTKMPASQSLCPGVLAFYIAMLDERLGHYKPAIREYQYAAGKLGQVAPYINLGELYMQTGNVSQAFASFDEAVDADPNSLAAVATRAIYERDYSQPRQAATDLDRATRMTPRNLFDRLALSGALYARGGKGDTLCGIRALERAMHSRGFNRQSNVDTIVRYAVWLIGQKRYADAASQLEFVLQRDPRHVEGNYELGLALGLQNPADKSPAVSYLRRATFATIYSDDDALYAANAAAHLVQHYDTDPMQKRRDYAAAYGLYSESIAKNPYAVYAYYGRAVMESTRDPGRAGQDFKQAANLRPTDPMLQSALAQYYDKHDLKRLGAVYHAKAKLLITQRIPRDEQSNWSSLTCRYEHLDAPY